MDLGLLLLITIIIVVVFVIVSVPDEATRQARLRAKFEEQRGRLLEQMELCWANVGLIQAQMTLDQVLARQQYLNSLSKRKRGLLEARLRASAEAEASARHQLAQLEAENY